MLALAAALGRGAWILLIDELSLGLAPLVVDDLLATVRRAADGGIGVVLVEQHVRQAMQVADRMLVMERGRINVQGSVDEMAQRLEEIEAGYLSGGTS